MAATTSTPLLLAAVPALPSLEVPWEVVKWRSRVALAAYAILFLAAVIFGLYKLASLHSAANTWALVTSLIALGISIPLTAYDINAHVQNYISPLQRYYMCVPCFPCTPSAPPVRDSLPHSHTHRPPPPPPSSAASCC
jgi:hypothetical protein